MKNSWVVLALLLGSLACCLLGQSVDRVEYNDFSKGIYAATDFRLSEPGQFTKLSNGLITPTGGIASRRAFTKTLYGSTISSSRVGSFQGGKIFWNDGSSFFYQSQIICSGTIPMFRMFSDTELFMVDQTTSSASVFFLPPTSAVVQAATFPATIRDCIVHNDRVFVAAGSVLYETSVGSSTDFTGGEAWSIPEGGPIYGLGIADDNLYIFKENRIYLMTGYSPAERSISLFSPTIGCTSQGGDSAFSGVISFTSKAVGDGIVFFSDPRTLSLISGGNVYRAGDHLSDHFSITAGARTIHALKGIGCAAFFSGNGLGENVILNLEYIYQGPGGLVIPATTWKIPYTIYGPDTPAIVGPLIAASGTYPLCLYDALDFYGRLDNYDGTATPKAIEMQIQTPHEAFGDERYLKTVKRLSVRGTKYASATNASATVFAYRDMSTTGTACASYSNLSIASSVWTLNAWPTGYGERWSYGITMTASTTPYVTNPILSIRSIVLDFVTGSRTYY